MNDSDRLTIEMILGCEITVLFVLQSSKILLYIYIYRQIDCLKADGFNMWPLGDRPKCSKSEVPNLRLRTGSGP